MFCQCYHTCLCNYKTLHLHKVRNRHEMFRTSWTLKFCYCRYQIPVLFSRPDFRSMKPSEWENPLEWLWTKSVMKLNSWFMHTIQKENLFFLIGHFVLLLLKWISILFFTETWPLTFKHSSERINRREAVNEIRSRFSFWWWRRSGWYRDNTLNFYWEYARFEPAILSD